MKEYTDRHFTGERALFRERDAVIDHCLFDDGESPLKEGRNLVVKNTTFGWKYPLWYGDGHLVQHCTFLEMSRSGLWYTNNSTFEDCDIIAPKEFRRSHDLSLRNIVFHNAQETLWTCHNVIMDNVKAKGDYFGMNSTSLKIRDFHLDGNYPFDGGKDIEITDSVLNSKDAFWNCENVTLRNCTINGEYFGWNSKNIVLENCTITSHQGFCYMENLTLRNCSVLDGTDLAFEYCSNIDVQTDGILPSVKNPYSGIIRARFITDLIMDKDAGIDPSKTTVITEDK